VQVHHDEGVANHIGPKPCADIREGISEASAGERAGQVSSRESYLTPDADAIRTAEGNMIGCANASTRATRRGRRPWHARTLLAREPGELPIGQRRRQARVRTGKARSRSR
jgi:hypothetical protein